MGGDAVGIHALSREQGIEQRVVAARAESECCRVPEAGDVNVKLMVKALVQLRN